MSTKLFLIYNQNKNLLQKMFFEVHTKIVSIVKTLELCQKPITFVQDIY